MRKIYVLLFAICAVAPLFGQHEITGVTQKSIQHESIMSSSKVATIDTITDYLDRATAYYILTAGTSGYVLGTSDFITETGSHYDDLGAPTTVTELMIYFVHKEIMGGSADTLTCNVHNVGADSLPASLNAFGKVSVADIDTAGFPTFIMMTTSAGPITSAGFVVSVDYGSIDDTIAVLSSNPTATSGGPDGNGERRCVQNTSAAGWVPAADIWTIASVPYNADAMIIPIVDVGLVGVSEGLSTKEFTLKGNYPNPAATFTNIVYSLPTANSVEIVVFDVKGQIVGKTGQMQKSAGEHEAHIDLSNYAPGAYYYRVATPNSSLVSKFVVVK